MISRPYHLYTKTSIQLQVAKRKRFLRVTYVPYTFCDAAILNATINVTVQFDNSAHNG